MDLREENKDFQISRLCLEFVYFEELAGIRVLTRITKSARKKTIEFVILNSDNAGDITLKETFRRKEKYDAR